MKPIISPSILSADFGYLARDIEMINESEAEWVHIDIMDGVFASDDCTAGEVYSGGEGSGGTCHECALRGLSASAPCGAANPRSRDAAGGNN